MMTSTAPSMNDPAFEHMPFKTVARELARDIHQAPDIIARFGMSREQGALLLRQASFKRLYQTEKALWEGTDNAGERTKQYHREAQALVASEMVAKILDPAVPLAMQVDIWKHSSKLAGIDTPPKQAGADGPAGTSFSVNIHLGEGKVERLTTTVAAPVIEHEGEGGT